MKQESQLLYLEFTELWKTLCDSHNKLYQVTCDEYLALLNSDINLVHQLLSVKEDLMKQIDSLDRERSSLVNRVALQANIPSESLKKFKTVYDYLRDQLALNEQNPLIKYHQLMIELVEKTQDQNKKNRIFLNKALSSIQDLRKELNGNIKVNNYSRTGEKQAHCR